MVPLRVLLVEDEVLAAMLVVDVLEDAGCQVARTATGLTEGLAFVREGDFDVALLDVNLGGGERSLVIAEALRDQGIPFAFITAYTGSALGERFPTVPVVRKPFVPMQLRRVLEELSPQGLEH